MRKKFTSLIRSIGAGLAMAAAAVAPWHSASADVVTLNFTDWDFPGSWSGNSYVAKELYIEGYTVNMTASRQAATLTDCPVTKGSPITVTFPEGTSCSHVTLQLKQWNTKTQTVTLNTSTDGTNFTATSDKSSNFTLDADLAEDVKAVRFTFSSTSNQVGIASITLTEVGQAVNPNAPANPTIAFDDITNVVTLNCTTEDASIYYTLNDDEPSAANGTLYTAPFTISETCTVKAIAVKEGVSSNVVSRALTVIPAANSIAELIEIAPAKNDVVKVGCDLTVVYKGGKYIYVVDAEGGALLLYDNNYANVEVNSGDIIPAGWIATNNLYNGLIEFSGTFPQPTGATGTFTIPEVETVSADDINHVVIIKNVTFDAETNANNTNFNGTLSDESTLQFRNNFGIASTEAGKYNVKAAIGIYNSTLQAYPIEYIEASPELLISDPRVRLFDAYPGIQLKATTYLSGQNLTSDATITCPEGVTCNHTTLTAEELMAEEPVELIFTITTPSQAGEYTKEVTISSEGAQDVTVTITGSVMNVVSLPNASSVMSTFESGNYYEDTYKYTGKAVVTYIEQGEYVYNIYAQDMSGGLCFIVDESVLGDVKVGDTITDIFCFMDGYLSAPQLWAMPYNADGDYCTIVSEGNPKTPTPIEISEVTSANALSYVYRLLSISNVHFLDAEGQKFAANKTYKVTDGTNEAVVKVFAGSDIIGTDIPTGKVTLNGISTSATQFTLSLRTLGDIQIGTPEAEITRELKFDFTNNAAPVGQETEIAQYTVVAENLPVAVPVLITGADAAMFKAEPASIPAGSATTVVKILYNPTSIGTHKGGVMFDFDAINPELNYTNQFPTCKAYDPDNMPSITIEPAVIEIETVPGQPVTATAVLNSTGTFDYITATRLGTGDNGGITINNTYLPAGSNDITLTVTFSPKDKGEFTETWTYTTTLCDTPATLTVKATCKEPAPVEDPEGDEELKADFSNPYTWYTQDFAAVEQNKPLSIEGWTNLAIEGTRAWWGHLGANGEDFTAAKVTAYDSTVKPGEGTPCQMALISPALDYKNATEKTLKFRLMGMYLNENSGDKLEVKFGEQTTDEEGEPTVEFYPMTNFNIPTTADEAGEWIDYVVDMSVIEDMPDTFLIAFEFTGTRGADNTTTYYITDFVWGAEPSSVNAIAADGITPDADGWYTLYNMQGIRVIRTRDAQDLKTLPAGLYIGNGRKYILK